jgi:hypothetical protein
MVPHCLPLRSLLWRFVSTDFLDINWYYNLINYSWHMTKAFQLSPLWIGEKHFENKRHDTILVNGPNKWLKKLHMTSLLGTCPLFTQVLISLARFEMPKAKTCFIQCTHGVQIWSSISILVHELLIFIIFLNQKWILNEMDRLRVLKCH